MFDMQVPWWELIARPVLVYVAMLAMVRLSGKRTIGEFSPFDVIVLLLIAESAQGSLTGNEGSVQGGLIAIATLILLNYLVAFVATRSNKAESLIEGDPVTLIRGGVKRTDALRKNNIPDGDLAEAMRSKGIKHESEVEWAVLEPDGEISFFKRHGKKTEDSA
jgi:uncharacterized membrane protein YcaP (DUF421 family)